MWLLEHLTLLVLMLVVLTPIALAAWALLALACGVLGIPLYSPETAPTGGREPIPFALRTQVLERDDWACVRCRSKVNLEIDHIIPYNKGGATTLDNLEVLYGPCNRAKGAK